MTDAFTQILFANLALAGGVLAVLALRKPVRAHFGPRLAYVLWLLPPLTALASLLPPRTIEITRPAQDFVDTMEVSVSLALPEGIPLPFTPTVAPAATLDPWTIALIVWLAGAALMTLWLAFSQLRFLREMRNGKAGPAVVGFLRPRIVTPADFADRFDERERSVIITHETIHLKRQDARVNALVALTRVGLWFNPLVHVGAYYLRIDQELACDATVIERHPNARKSYAGALLKAQLAARPLPLGCYWPASADHPLTERIEMLKRNAPGRMRRIAGAALLATLGSGAGLAAWAALPVQAQYVPADLPAMAEPIAQDQPAPAPQPPIEQPVPIPAPVRAPAPQPTTAFDLNDVLAVQGNIIRVDGDGPMAIVWLQATDIIRKGGQIPNALVWRLETRLPTTPADRLKVGAQIRVVGYNAIDKACTPNCRLQVYGWNLSMKGKSRYPVGFAPPPAEDDLLFRGLPPIENPQPIAMPVLARATSITADRITTDAQTGDTIYEGNVQIMVGGAIMKTDRIVISANKDEIEPWGVWERLGPDGGKTESMLLAPPDPRAALKIPQAGQTLPTYAPFEAARGDTTGKFKPIVLEGTVTDVRWVNPSTQIYLRDRSGKDWYVLSGTPNNMLRHGATQDTLREGTRISLRGYQAADMKCDPVCAGLASPGDITLDGIRLTLSAAPLSAAAPQPPEAESLLPSRDLEQELTKRLSLLPGEHPGMPFAALFDADAPITLTGKVTKMELLDPNSFMWVEAEGKLYKVMIPRLRMLPEAMKAPAFVGKPVTVRGYEAKDKTCKPECLVSGRDVRTQDDQGAAIGWTIMPSGGIALPAPAPPPQPAPVKRD